MQQSLPYQADKVPLRAAKPIWDNWYQIKYLDPMPQPYIHHVHSKPTKVSESTWKQWYFEERSRDMVYFKVSRNAAFYEAIGPTLTYLDPPNDGVGEMPFLAIYQMGKTIPRYMPEYQNHVRVKSGLWDSDKTCFQVAKFDSDHLELVEILGSYEYTEDVAPYIIHAKVIGEDVESKLQFEHVNVASKIDGYRRSLLYRSVMWTQKTPYVIFLHEFESEPSSLESMKAEMEAIEPSRDCAFSIRSFELLDSEGFAGECRKPERLND